MDSADLFGLSRTMYRTGLIGRSILASRSPWLHEQEARALGIDLSYTLFDFTQRGFDDCALAPLLHRLAGEGYSGVNVTFPFKQAVIPLLDALSESAEMVGAVNAVAIRDGRLIGHNTDMSGFRASLESGLADRVQNRVLQLGAGGAGAAVGNALLASGTGCLVISDIDRSRAELLAAKLADRFGPGRALTVEAEAIDTADIDGIVNASPMGMSANPVSAIAPDLISPHHWVVDIVYFPLETEMLKQARARGCRVLNGSGMVVAQAALAFEIFTGRKADVARMHRSFLAK